MAKVLRWHSINFRSLVCRLDHMPNIDIIDLTMTEDILKEVLNDPLDDIQSSLLLNVPFLRTDVFL